ncbi:MAG: anthranilate synthase component I [Clostridia bacterium]|nr:anthranilate synthase component I [Clostridia bacterium]
MIRPGREEFLRLCRIHPVVPVVREVGGDLFTPVSLYRRFGDEPDTFLLESVEDGSRWGRYSIMGRRPMLRFESRGDQVIMESGGTVETASGDVPGRLAGFLGRYAAGGFDYIPKFHCGLAGYFAYDYARCLERLPDDNPDRIGLPDCRLQAPGEVIVYDHLRCRMQIIVNCPADRGADGYEEALGRIERIREEILAAPDRLVPVADVPAEADFVSSSTREEYCGMVRKAIEHIRAGDIFQVVLSQRFSAPYAGDPFLVYRALRSVNPSPYLFCFRYADATLVGASPEMLLRVEDGTVSTRPIAGTRPRGETPERDAALAAELLADEKERSEHFMLVDLARNDVGRVSEFGSVRAAGICRVERFSHVMHLVTDVEGRLRPDRSAVDALGAILPAGTLSGAPKVRAMEIIDGLEPLRRGFYGGAAGYLGFDGGMDTCIAIRAAVIRNGSIHIQAGAGIVADSDPETEYEETRNKARALFASLGNVEEML